MINPGSDSARHRALGEFLRSVRARVSPQAVGMPAGARRRTPGLRREEVAQLAGISVTWYTWIEQGRDVSVSAAVWSRLAGVLQMNRAERHYLFELAEAADPEHGRETPEQLPEGLQLCVDSVTVPAYILDRSWNVLCRNSLMLALFSGWPDRDAEPNLLRFMFQDEAAKTLVEDWEARAQRVVAEFRAETASFAEEPEVSALIESLLETSPVFAHWWTRQTVIEREGGRRAFFHPDKGRISYRQMTFHLAIRPDCKLVMLLDEAD